MRKELFHNSEKRIRFFFCFLRLLQGFISAVLLIHLLPWFEWETLSFSVVYAGENDRASTSRRARDQPIRAIYAARPASYDA